VQQQKRRRIFRPGLPVKNGESIHQYRAIKRRVLHWSPRYGILFRLLLIVHLPLSIRAISWIVFRAEVFHSKWPHRGDLRDILAGFRPVEMVRVAREDDHRAGRIGFQLTRVEFIAQSDIKNARNHRKDSIFRVLVRHQLHAVGRFDPDGVRAGLRRLTHDDGQPDRRRERRERFPIDIVGQDGFENLLPALVKPDCAWLGTLYGAGSQTYKPPSCTQCNTSP